MVGEDDSSLHDFLTFYLYLYLRGGQSKLSSAEGIIRSSPMRSHEITQRLYKSLRLEQTSKECAVELVGVH